MSRLGRFAALPAADKWLVFKAWALVWAVRIALWVLPFKVLRRILRKISRHPPRRIQSTPHPVERVAWAIMTASRYVPGARHCLTRALAVETLLSRRGYRTQLHVGVARDDDKGIIAHAWVDTGGKVIMGGEELEKYTELKPSMSEPRRD